MIQNQRRIGAVRVCKIPRRALTAFASLSGFRQRGEREILQHSFPNDQQPLLFQVRGYRAKQHLAQRGSGFGILVVGSLNSKVSLLLCLARDRSIAGSQKLVSLSSD